MKALMLTDDQIAEIWDEMIAAEVRGLYFGDLGARFTRRKQIISGVSFFLSSGAAATIVAKSPSWIPVLLSTLTALVTAYSIAVGLDRKSTTMAKLYSTWSQIESECRSLWNHWYEDNAETTFNEIQSRIRQASELAITDAPYDKELVSKWRTYVHQEHGLTPA
jgi:vacuolar-type H+-ATPase catalytic subunit A/Vma1